MRLRQALRRLGSIPDLPETDREDALAQHDYDSAQAALEAFGLAMDLAGQRVLDLGCGFGGKTVFYAEKGAELVVGLDRSEVRACMAQAFAARHAAGARAQILVADAAYLPFRAESFTTIISTDTWEHLCDPLQALHESARVVRSSGTIWISTMPYYSPWGAHAWLWFPLPWLPSFLPRQILLQLISGIESRQSVNARLPEEARLDWTCPDDPGLAQQLTVAALERHVASSGLETALFQILPVGADYGGLMTRLVRRLVRLPVLKEVLAGLVFVVLRKP